jgi:AraC family transcriptional regulator of adaptative response/methylated-DNA-[protein]-cysteine methyltransferase
MERREIGCRTVRCALGWLLVAGTERGVCAVMLGDSRESLLEALRAEFPWAALGSGEGRLNDWTEILTALAAGRAPAGEVPLDVRGSRFQRRVWDALRAIPPGETRSYGELARALGAPRGARAVARACATNPVALAVPCHRVIGVDGELCGYRWGTERKRALLKREEGDDSSRSPDGLGCCHGSRRQSSAA